MLLASGLLPVGFLYLCLPPRISLRCGIQLSAGWTDAEAFRNRVVLVKQRHHIIHLPPVQTPKALGQSVGFHDELGLIGVAAQQRNPVRKEHHRHDVRRTEANAQRLFIAIGLDGAAEVFQCMNGFGGDCLQSTTGLGQFEWIVACYGRSAALRTEANKG